MSRSIGLPDDLASSVDELARSQGKTAEEVVEEATRRYLARTRLERLVARNEQRAREVGLMEADVPRLVKEFRRERRVE
jgi:predicted transcriptional regulator